jgi:hypothetical protein
MAVIRPSSAPPDFARAQAFMRISAAEVATNDLLSLKQIAQKFDYWMKNYDHTNSVDQELLDWLFDDDGIKDIKSYESFCELAEELRGMGYDIPIIPSEAEYNEYSKRAIEAEPASHLSWIKA